MNQMFLNDFTTVCTWQGLTYCISGRFHVAFFTLYLHIKIQNIVILLQQNVSKEKSIARPGDQELDRTSILCYTVCIRETMWEKRDLNIFFLFGLLYNIYDGKIHCTDIKVVTWFSKYKMGSKRIKINATYIHPYTNNWLINMTSWFVEKSIY